MVSTLHILLTYRCPLRCDHCYVFGSPRSEGNLTSTQVNHLLNQAMQLKSVEWVIFGGGEPFLYFPLLLKSVQKACKLGFKVGVFSNGFFARTEAAALSYLRPLKELGLDSFYISNDRFHFPGQEKNPALRAIRAAFSLGIQVNIESIRGWGEPEPQSVKDFDVVYQHSTRLLMAGRAVERLASQLPKTDPLTMTSCPDNRAINPDSIAIDASGNIQICPGLSIGNTWKTSLPEIINHYDPAEHPICGPLSSGGPLLLSEKYAYDLGNGFVDSCHLCFMVRCSLIDRFPEHLAPKQVYFPSVQDKHNS